MPAILPRIDHIVVLMLENRSLDNLLGWLYADNGSKAERTIGPALPDRPPNYYDGLEPGKYSLPLAYGGEARHHPIMRGTCGNGLAVPSLDPWEEYEHVTNQLFGTEAKYENPTPEKPAEPTMQGFLQDFTESYINNSQYIEAIREFLMDTPTGDLPSGWRAWLLRVLDTEGLGKGSLQTWYQSLQILGTFTPDQVPVLNGLAKGYAVSDRWFCSVPSQTNPNRAFFHCGTSLGMEKNANVFADEQFDADTLFNVLDYYNRHGSQENRCTWGIYYHEPFPPKSGEPYTVHTFPHILDIPDAEQRVHEIGEFEKHVASGELPAFCFLEPKWGWGLNKDYPLDWNIPGIGKPYQQGNDYHPPTSVEDGEKFVKSVYDALRRNDDIWNRSLLIVTFDEHGGTWDHVPPPWGAIPPDDNLGKEFGFKFDRFGVRVPTILISPLIEKSTVFRSEKEIPYDHTSIIATVLKWKGIDPGAPDPRPKPSPEERGPGPNDGPGTGADEPWLGRRVASAPTFEAVVTRINPRPKSDIPEVTPAPISPPPPIKIKNDTPAQIYVYLGYGPERDPTQEHELPKLPTSIWGGIKGRGNGAVESGASVTYSTGEKVGGELFDYWVQASYWVGPGANTPSDLVDSVLGLNKQWRLFWKGWKLVTHHQTLAISLPPPEVSITGSNEKGTIRIVNRSVVPIYYAIRKGRRPLKNTGKVPPRGQQYDYATSGDWMDWNYYLRLSYWASGYLRKDWKNLWSGWRQIGRSATVTVSGPEPQVSVTCPKN